MILYIAGPMTGLPEYNHPAFHAAEAVLTSLGYTVLNPARTDLPADTSWEDWMRAGLRQVLEADGIALLPGWERSRGANMERFVAASLSLHIRDLEGWINP